MSSKLFKVPLCLQLSRQAEELSLSWLLRNAPLKKVQYLLMLQKASQGLSLPNARPSHTF